MNKFIEIAIKGVIIYLINVVGLPKLKQYIKRQVRGLFSGGFSRNKNKRYRKPKYQRGSGYGRYSQPRTSVMGYNHVFPAQLHHVTDGDTASFICNGEKISVRFLLIDTPETKHPNKGVQPFGPEASQYTKMRLQQAQQIVLDFDTKGYYGDKYNRKLAYVYVDGNDLNMELLQRGLARIGYVYKPNTKNYDKYCQAEQFARQRRLGIWSIRGYVTDKGFNAG